MSGKFNLKCLFSKRYQNGFSMIEVLITILIFSFGLLGMAVLVTTGMRSNNVAQYRSIATQQTLDMADRMRANLAGVRSGSYDDLGADILVSSDCVAAECDTAQLAVYDQSQWNTANAALLPGGAGTVAGSLATGFLITLMWGEKEMGGAADPICPEDTPAGTRCFLTRFSP